MGTGSSSDSANHDVKSENEEADLKTVAVAVRKEIARLEQLLHPHSQMIAQLYDALAGLLSGQVNFDLGMLRTRGCTVRFSIESFHVFFFLNTSCTGSLPGSSPSRTSCSSNIGSVISSL